MTQSPRIERFEDEKIAIGTRKRLFWTFFQVNSLRKAIFRLFWAQFDRRRLCVVSLLLAT